MPELELGCFIRSRSTSSGSGSTTTMLASRRACFRHPPRWRDDHHRQNVRVNTAFNAGTTNALNVGTTAAVRRSSPMLLPLARVQPAIANLSFAVDTDLFVSYAQTGALQRRVRRTSLSALFRTTTSKGAQSMDKEVQRSAFRGGLYARGFERSRR
jgi:hypothetical protein